MDIPRKRLSLTRFIRRIIMEWYTPRTLKIAAVAILSIILVVLVLSRPATEEPRWSQTFWQSGNAGDRSIEHFAVMLEIQLDGMTSPARMQLDLGSDATMVYAVPYLLLDRNDKLIGRNKLSLSGVLAGHRFQNETFYVRPPFDEIPELPISGDSIVPSGPIRLGTVGADFFAQRILLLDYVRKRVAILQKRAVLPSSIERRIDFLPLEFRYRKIFVTATLDGREERDMIFDTGSSVFPLVTPRSRWRELTGRRQDDPGNDVLRVNSWGKEARLVGAPMKGALCVGKACLSAPLVYFESSGLTHVDLDRAPFKVTGVFGNAVFDGRFTVVVDIRHRRFGLVAGSIADLGK